MTQLRTERLTHGPAALPWGGGRAARAYGALLLNKGLVCGLGCAMNAHATVSSVEWEN